ncbi:MAG: hypothetical protein ACRD8U_11545 [Pyrinomonadaceae bacterium]
MEESPKLFELIRILMSQLPSLITLVVCLVIAILRWKRHPRVSLVLASGLLFLLLNILLFATQVLWLPDLVVGRRIFVDSESIQTFFAVMSFIYNTGLAIGLSLLLASIFMQRRVELPRTG